MVRLAVGAAVWTWILRLRGMLLDIGILLTWVSDSQRSASPPPRPLSYGFHEGACDEMKFGGRREAGTLSAESLRPK